MTTSRLEIPNVSGKIVESIVLHNGPLSDREVTIRFSDNTELAVAVECQQIADVRHYDVNSDRTLFEMDEGAQ